MRKLSWAAIIFVITLFSAEATANNKFMCEGIVSNSFAQDHPQYKEFGKRTIDFEYECPLFAYIRQKSCTGKIFSKDFIASYYSREDGDFIADSSPQFIFYFESKIIMAKLHDGKDYTEQFWFHGKCK